jgi:collagenase-like PrtC family protease
MSISKRVHYHLPGLFEFYELYSIFLPLFFKHREYFYDWCDIGSIYGAPADCLWGGGRAGFGEADAQEVFALMNEYGISSRLTFSNSLLKEDHLADKKCNFLCSLFEKSKVAGGVIVHSDLLAEYLRRNFPKLYLVSSTTKVLTDFKDFESELNRDDFKFVVPDFRLNKNFDDLKNLSQSQKDKVEFLCNECCDPGCKNRKLCYENVSRKNLGEAAADYKCTSKNASGGYRFSLAMKNPLFIGLQNIQEYVSLGFSNFKIEGRGLGSAVVLEFLLYYMTKPEYQLEVREAIYLDSMLDLF